MIEIKSLTLQRGLKVLLDKANATVNPGQRVGLIGKNGTGKSSLFNRLTKADVLAKDQLFATLDTTARRLFLSHEAGVILTDTVGFVRDLPHKLVSAFSATLEETALADVLLHVVDASNSDFERQRDDVNVVLEESGAHEVPQLVVYNKIDLCRAFFSCPIKNRIFLRGNQLLQNILVG